MFEYSRSTINVLTEFSSLILVDADSGDYISFGNLISHRQSIDQPGGTNVHHCNFCITNVAWSVGEA